MHAQPPPPAPPAITVEQQQDLNCVSVGLMVGGGPYGARGGWNSRMARFYLWRLQTQDQSRDWRGMVVAVPNTLTYREFLERMSDCNSRMPPPRPVVRPPQPAQPVETPLTPTGG